MTKTEIQRVFDDLAGLKSPFLDSLREFFSDAGFLTPKQQAALIKLYNRHFLS